MKNQKFRKMLAAMLATSMILGMGVTAFADTSGDVSGDAGNGGTTGTGTFEGHVDQNVLEVTLPTDTSGTTFDYKMDPEGLIAATDGAKHSGATFEEGKNVFFQSEANTWTAESAKLKVKNTGTVAADVTVTAKTADNAKIAMADSATFTASDKAAKLYLGLKAADKPAVAVKDTSSGGASITLGLAGNADNYEIKSKSTGGYEFAKKDGVLDSQWNNFEFSLTGACNPNGDYSAQDLAASAVTLTWSYRKRAADSSADLLAANAVTGPQMSLSSGGYITITGLTAEKNYGGSMSVDYDEGNIAVGEGTTWDTENYDAETGGDLGIQLSDAWLTWLSGQTITVKLTLSDNSVIQASATLD